MSNYHYLVASLPDLAKDKAIAERSPESIIGEIRANCGQRDLAAVDLLLSGYEDSNLTPEFYEKALSHKNAFIRDWFRFDLNVRNAKVRYLNKELGREAEKDIMSVDGGVFDEGRELDKILSQSDILGRERGIDDLLWKKADSLATFHYFDVETVLAFIIKLKIIERWLKLDEETGKEMFRSLVDEVRGTFKGVESARVTD